VVSGKLGGDEHLVQHEWLPLSLTGFDLSLNNTDLEDSQDRLHMSQG
jgi:hypothetical protein